MSEVLHIGGGPLRLVQVGWGVGVAAFELYMPSKLRRLYMPSKKRKKVDAKVKKTIDSRGELCDCSDVSNKQHMKDEDTMQTFNGWTNAATWRVNLWFGDALYELRRDSGRDLVADDCREYVWALTEDMHPEVFGASFVSDLIASALCEVNWWELARHTNDMSDFEEVA